MNRNMKKTGLMLIMVLMLLLSCIPAFATSDSEPVTYKDTITVTEDGGRYKLGFVEVEFKKNYIDANLLPVTFEVEIYAENGQAFIEFEPDAQDFIKKVHIRAKKYDGLLFDKATGENIHITLKTQQILAEHFSRYNFHD